MTETKANNSWGSTIAAGAIGALLASGITLVAAPKLMGERIVREALTEHPELLVEAGEALKSKQYAQALAPIRAALERPFYSSWKGAEKPKVVMTYFYDYSCGYCRMSNPDIERLIKDNPDLRVVYRELPILGPESVDAARVALAASKAGKFAQFHDTLYAIGRPSAETIARAAAAAGVSPKPVNDPAQEAELNSNMSLASQLGATGTPLFVIGNEVHNAAVGYDVLSRAVEAARKS